MKVSIITPSYNQASFLGNTIKSVLEQTYPNIEYIVVDGGSDDASVDIIKTHADRIAYWVSEPDQGQSDAIRKGFEHASGDILAWLNSDDVLSLDAVERAVGFFEKNPDIDFVYGNRLAVDEQGRVLYKKRMLPSGAMSVYLSMVLGQESCFWRRELYDRVGGVNPERFFSMDYELFSKMAQQGRFKYCPGIWGGFRIHASSRTMKEYATFGKKDVAEVQQSVWGKQPSTLAWHSISLLVKIWGCAGIWTRNPGIWPEGFLSSDKLTIKERLSASFHEGSRFRSLTKWFR